MTKKKNDFIPPRNGDVIEINTFCRNPFTWKRFGHDGNSQHMFPSYVVPKYFINYTKHAPEKASVRTQNISYIPLEMRDGFSPFRSAYPKSLFPCTHQYQCAVSAKFDANQSRPSSAASRIASSDVPSSRLNVTSSSSAVITLTPHASSGANTRCETPQHGLWTRGKAFFSTAWNLSVALNNNLMESVPFESLFLGFPNDCFRYGRESCW